MPVLTDDQLIVLAAKGNEAAFEQLVKRYLAPVYRFVYGYVGNQFEAEDVTQEVFVKVWKKLRQFDQGRRFKPWLFEIAKNTAFDLLRRKAARPLTYFDSITGDAHLEQTLVDVTPGPEFKAEQTLLRARLDWGLKQLTRPYARVVELYHHEHLNFREIAGTTGESINTVKSRYRRALLKLKQLLTGYS